MPCRKAPAKTRKALLNALKGFSEPAGCKEIVENPAFSLQK